MIRPQPCRWFEIMVARDDAFTALEALASAGCIEVEWHQTEAPGASMPQDLLKDFNALARRYRAYWPAPATALAAERRAPADALADGLRTAHAWAAEADPTIARLQAADAEVAELELAAAALRELADSRIDFAALARADHGVTAALFALPQGVEIDLPEDTITRFAAVANERLLLAIGAPEHVEAIGRAVAEVNGRRARFPDWLQPSAAANLSLVAEKLAEKKRASAALRSELDAISVRHGLAQALGAIARATWCFEHGGAIEQGDVFARITGWAADREKLVRALESSDARALATFPTPPRGARPPLVLRNPWWAQPFEIFTRLVGMPAASGADPTVLLALAVPLMFGYMFGDVGQGLVLAGFGWFVQKRMPLLRLLVPGGLSAAAFGVVFGSVFCLEGLIQPLWLHPIEHPLPVLMVPIAGGALLLAVGLLLGGLEAWWETRFDRWLREDAPVLATYAGVLLGLVWSPGWWLVGLGVGWAVVAALLERATPKSAFGALGELLEHAVQVLINTLSFARVGAFALAHAGLSSAVVALSTASDNPLVGGLVLVVGNLLILVVEGLVVSIQTTRLVLFEFFTRFFRAEGREFRPLAAPPVTLVTEESP
jgi:V/A-type H+-transporting ATPase subunit I